MTPATPHENRGPAGVDPHVVRLAEAARQGDRTAFHQLMDRFQAEIFRMVYYRTRSRLDAEDITQDVFLQAFKHIARLKSALVFRSWLYRIAVNRVRDHFRRQRFKAIFGLVSMDAEEFQESAALAEMPQATAQISRQEFWRQIEEVLASLSPMEREVFLLRFFDELSIKEMTAALKKNESTIKTHLYRALGKVKNALTDRRGLWEGL